MLRMDGFQFHAASTAEDAVQLIVFPECCLSGYWHLRKLDREALEDLARTKGGFPPFEALRGSFTKAVNNCNVIVLNQNTPADIDYSEGFNILIGGNSLGRGVTFPALQTVYYCRSTKVPQADTMWQHSRMFGYDRDGDQLPARNPRHLVFRYFGG